MDLSEVKLEQTGWAVSGRVYASLDGKEFSCMMDNTEVDFPLTKERMLAAVNLESRFPGAKILKADLDIWKVKAGFITNWYRCLHVSERYQHLFNKPEKLQEKPAKFVS